MSERLDPEEVRDIMNAVWQRLDAAIIERGGVIDKHIGDAVMALFGLPSARVDDPQRSVAYRAVAQMITATALRRPAVMLFEDLHASDDASLDLSAWLLASCQDIPVLCDHAYRPTLYERRPTWGAGIRRHTRLASLSIPPTLTGVLQTRLDALEAEAIETRRLRIERMRQTVRGAVPTPDAVEMVLKLIEELHRRKLDRKFVDYSPGPRAAQTLLLAGKANSLLKEDSPGYTFPEDIQPNVLAALSHRLILNFEAEAQQKNAESIVNEILNGSK